MIVAEKKVVRKNSSKASKEVTTVAVAHGDGIGPEIMKATLRIVRAAGANVEFEPISVGETQYLSGETSGIGKHAWDTIAKHRVLLKGPITTPQGKGYKSLNVTMRKTLGLFANVRPVQALHPYVETHFPDMDVVIIRENEEDLYAGIEHQQTADVVQCLKLITRPGCEKIVRYAFEYAKAYGRKKVTCMVKDNIMKLTDGLFHRVFEEIGAEYPDIKQDTQIIDIASARLATRPEDYDVIVTSNLYGDIISDIAAELAGSVGMAGSANIGTNVAMFEAIHGSAPDISGQNIANPSGLLNAAVMMLVHVGEAEAADKIKNAWLRTIEDGIHTPDIYSKKHSTQRVGTNEFASALIERLGKRPFTIPSSTLSEGSGKIEIPTFIRKKVEKTLLGVDVFLDWAQDNPQVIGEALEAIEKPGMKLKMITNRGVKVYPNGHPETFCTDHWRCRFVSTDTVVKADHPVYAQINMEQLLQLLNAIHEGGFDIIKTENLYEFDGVRGFSLGQEE
ncbi:NADP-dependent isocitrate dehydrogenase [bacterium]|nr:NADP-dependent isocitrate dehydrogenase [bacterium]